MTQNLADELEAPKPGTPLPWQYRDDYTSEGFVTIIGNIDGEYVDGWANCTYDVVCRCEDEFGERLPNVAQNVRYIVRACNEYPALTAERDALKAELAHEKVEADVAREMREIAQEELGFPSILEALESVSYLREERDALKAKVEGLVEELEKIVEETKYVQNHYAYTAFRIARAALAAHLGEQP